MRTSSVIIEGAPTYHPLILTTVIPHVPHWSKHNLFGHSTLVEIWALPEEEELAIDSNNLIGLLTPF
jgi:hypothetical protein